MHFVYAILYTLLLTACRGSVSLSHEERIKSQSLIYALPNPYTHLDLHTTQQTAIMSILQHILEPLYHLSEAGEVEPLLTTSLPRISLDGLRYDFELKPEIYFHNGEKLTTKDILFSFHRIFNHANPAIAANTYIMIQGAKAMLKGESTELAGLVIEDDRHFSIYLEHPFSPFLKALCLGYVAILPENAYLQNSNSWGNRYLIGSGPYQLDAYQPNDFVKLKRSIYPYHGYQGQLERIEFRFINHHSTSLMAYEAGEVDIVQLPFDSYPHYARQEIYRNQIQEVKLLGTQLIVANLHTTLFANPLVRKAFDQAIDREALTTTIFHQLLQPTSSFIPPKLMGSKSDPFVTPYQPEEAKRLLAEAGYPQGIKIRAVYRSSSPTSRLVWTLIQSQAAAAGFEIELQEYENALWQEEKMQGKLDLYDTGWLANYADSDDILYRFLHSKHNTQHSLFYHSTLINLLLEEARSADDALYREKLYGLIEEIAIHEDHALYPIYYIKRYDLVKPYLKKFRPLNGIYDFSRAYLEKEESC